MKKIVLFLTMLASSKIAGYSLQELFAIASQDTNDADKKTNMLALGSALSAADFDARSVKTAAGKFPGGADALKAEIAKQKQGGGMARADIEKLVGPLPDIKDKKQAAEELAKFFKDSDKAGAKLLNELDKADASIVQNALATFAGKVQA